MNWLELVSALYGSELNEEYFALASRADRRVSIWDGARWLACYVVEGGSEGWYLHVDKISDEIVMNEDCSVQESGRQLMLIGKFWSYAGAERALLVATKLIHFK